MVPVADSIESRFVGHDLDVAELGAADLRENHFDVGNLDRRKAAAHGGLRGLNRLRASKQLPERFSTAERSRGNTRAATQSFQQISSIHHWSPVLQAVSSDSPRGGLKM
jgi:hypothetical protein